MRTLLPICLIIAILPAFSSSGRALPTGEDSAAVIRAALDYAEGYYEGDADRMARAVHPILTKRGLLPSSAGGSFLVQMNAEVLVEVTRLGRGKLDPDQRSIRAELLDLNGDIASARVFTARFNDFLHLVSTDGGWKIINVLWRPPTKESGGEPKDGEAEIGKAMAALRAAALAKDADAASKVIHPAVMKRSYTPIAKEGREIVQEMNAETLLELVRSGRAVQPGQPEPEVRILEVYEDIASVRLTGPGVVDYLHLAKQGDGWRIVNGLAALAPR